MDGGDESGQRIEPALQLTRLAVTAGLRQFKELRAQLRYDDRECQYSASRACADRRVKCRGRSRQHAKSLRRERNQIDQLLDIPARFLHAHDIRMLGEIGDGGRQQIDAREDRDVVPRIGTGDASATAR